MPHSPHVLNPERLAILKRIAAGEKFEMQRMRLHWFRNNGYLKLSPPPPATDGKLKRVRREYALTDKAHEALALDAATRAAS